MSTEVWVGLLLIGTWAFFPISMCLGMKWFDDDMITLKDHEHHDKSE